MADILKKAGGNESFASKFGAIMSMTGMAIRNPGRLRPLQAAWGRLWRPVNSCPECEWATLSSGRAPSAACPLRVGLRCSLTAMAAKYCIWTMPG